MTTKCSGVFASCSASPSRLCDLPCNYQVVKQIICENNRWNRCIVSGRLNDCQGWALLKKRMTSLVHIPSVVISGSVEPVLASYFVFFNRVWARFAISQISNRQGLGAACALTHLMIRTHSLPTCTWTPLSAWRVSQVHQGTASEWSLWRATC